VRRAALVAALAALALPAEAAAQGRVTLDARDVFAGKPESALAGRAFRVRVVMRPAAGGEQVVVRVFRHGKRVQSRRVTLKALTGGAAAATVKVKPAQDGELLIRSPGAQSVKVNVVRPSAGFGSRGPSVRLLQAQLAALRYEVPRSGVMDAGTGRAVMAWRKVAGMARTTAATSDVFTGLLAGRGRFKVRHPKDGRHVEARIGAQVLALVDKGKVQRIYHTSTGAPATPTVRGKFRVYRKQPGTNANGMVHSSYFIRGYAIHGYVSVPAFNASHGCLRVPIPNALFIYNWLRMGDVVWVEQ
jgi:lipoprotein-anchoring transpeptidase ErfK/SrfK